jgi:tRNA threonylcarbamoyladenosine biosynthesis protein TsaB
MIGFTQRRKDAKTKRRKDEKTGSAWGSRQNLEKQSLLPLALFARSPYKFSSNTLPNCSNAAEPSNTFERLNPFQFLFQTPRFMNPVTLQLAIETTTQGGSVAVSESGRLLGCHRLPVDVRSASTLLPAVMQVLKSADQTSLRDESSQSLRPDLIAVAIGPGSFTGIRIAVAAAKTLAYAWQSKLVVVDSLAAIAAAAMIDDDSLAEVEIVVNAYRGQAYFRKFDRLTLMGDFGVNHVDTTRVDLIEEINRTFDPRSSVRRLSDSKQIQSTGDWASLCVAGGVSHLGWAAFAAGQTVDPMSLIPKYLKPSSAEEALLG